MSGQLPQSGDNERIIILVTGANSGLGFSICCRLADDFLRANSSSRTLTVIFTTRSSKKGSDTLQRLQEHLNNSPVAKNEECKKRVEFIPENVDLTNLLSVRALSRRLNSSFPKLNSIVLNAGLGGWTGINWPLAIWSVCTDLVHAVSWPSYKVANAGVVTDSQTKLGSEEEPRLGAVFCANVFGHYMLAHNVVPLLRKAGEPNGPGRIIWVSSLEATVKMFDVDDIQGLRTVAPYESSKALTDVLTITSELPSSAPWVKSFYSVDDNRTLPSESKSTTTSENPTENKPSMYLSHPGICGSGILPLTLPFFYMMLCSFWLARMLGSPWHTVSTYLGACAPTWLAMSPRSTLDDAEAPYLENGGGRVKWGSSCSRNGCDKPVCTEVDGWGFGGVVGDHVCEEDRCRRRKRGAVDLTSEEKENFENLGRESWKKMEELRVKWDELLDKAEGLV